MSPDSSHQFSQAQRFKFADGHPVVMALIWTGTLLFVRGPGGFFLLLLLLYWGGFFLVSRYFVERSRPGLWAAAAVPFLPFVINFSGTLWKDALVSSASWSRSQSFCITSIGSGACLPFPSPLSFFS